MIVGEGVVDIYVVLVWVVLEWIESDLQIYVVESVGVVFDFMVICVVYLVGFNGGVMGLMEFVEYGLMMWLIILKLVLCFVVQGVVECICFGCMVEVCFMEVGCQVYDCFVDVGYWMVDVVFQGWVLSEVMQFSVQFVCFVIVFFCMNFVLVNDVVMGVIFFEEELL